MNILGKKINYIDLHNYLDGINTGTVISDLHYASVPLLHKAEADGAVEWEGKTYSKKELLERLTEEEGNISELTLAHTDFGPEAALKFDSGNGFTISLTREDQFGWIYKYLIEHP